MDTTDPDITFDEQGICSHCHGYDQELPKRVFKGAEAERKLNTLIKLIKTTGKDKEFDCIVGVSGGVDSTYVAYLATKFGLRPLAIHFDNGWNSELAVSNIEKTLDKLGIDLYTYVIDWEVFKDLQLSFLKASTPDGEVPTDHAINALLFREASKRGIKYILSGMNFTTESMSVKAWAYGHSDWKYINSVHKIFGSSNLRMYPHFNFLHLFWWTFIKKIKSVSILNYLEFNKEEVMKILQNDLEWVYYGGKHYESVYTRFYQGYILPQKFNIDKRRGHLSDLIKSGQLTREEALKEIDKPGYDPTLLNQDMQFVMKKLNLNQNDFDKIMELPKRSFKDYPNNEEKVNKLKKMVNYLRLKGLYSK
jgi:N-acetyl sugar amidotransferase